MNYLGDFKEDATIYIMFNTYTSNDPSASCTITNFINTDVHIHKDDGLAQRNNAAGITVSVDFDGITGSHMVKIDTSDNTVAGFWAAGHEYFVRIEGTTIDGATINSVVGQFSIENRFNEVDVTKISGDSTAADNAELAFDGTGFGFTNCTIPTVTTLNGHTAQTGDSFARLGAPAAASIAADLLAIDNFVDELETRLSAARAGYLDNLSVGAVALASGVDLTSIHGAALTETVNGYLAAAFVKLFDVASPLLVASEVMRGTDSAALAATALTDTTWTDVKAAFLDHSIATVDTVADGIQTDLDNATDGLGALKALIDTIDGIVDNILVDTNELQGDWANGGRLDLLLDACALEGTVSALNNISVADIIAGISDGSNDLQEMIRIMFAALAGKSSGGGTVTLKFRDSGDGKDRISATVDASGNRTAMTLDGS